MNTQVMDTESVVDLKLDALVIGAGVAGLYQLHRLREMGLTVRGFETGSGVGGTWYWNRYPGCRFDSQAEIYQYWFSEELYKSWQPSERFPGQPETEKWMNHVADHLDLRKDIEFNTRITSAHFDEAKGRWLVTTESGQIIDTQYVIACCGMLSAPLTDRFKGQSSFNGEIHHTALWPKEGVDMKGKRVAVVGTGATGIQVIQSIAPEAGLLKIFVRTPEYVIPMRNDKYTAEDWEQWGSKFHELKERVQGTFAGFDYDFDSPAWHDLTQVQRKEILEQRWEEGSLSLWLASFSEIFFETEASEEVSEFVREKMRARLNYDPELCDLLIPTDYGFGTHRVPLETQFLEVFLRDNVKAVNCRTSAIEEITPEGIKTADGIIHKVDVIVLAVGFDAGSGALSRIDIRGRDNRSLKEQWQGEIRTAMGLQVHGYPNLFTTGAPLAPSAALCNMPTCLQQQVDWITEFISHASANQQGVIEASKDFEDHWVEHHDEVANQTLVVKTNSWYMGSNVEGKPRRLLSYIGGVGNYRKHCDEQAAQGYPGFIIT